MMRILILGPSASGKTTLAHYFQKKGKNSVDADLAGIGIWKTKSGKVVKAPKGLGKKINQWAEQNNVLWVWDEIKLKKLLSKNKELYLFGGANNTYDFLEYFDRVYYLNASNALILKRLRKRLQDPKAYHQYGKTKTQQEEILKGIGVGRKKAKNAGLIFLPASSTPEKLFIRICKA